MTMNRKLFAKGFRHGIPIGLGYLSVAFTFGMKAVADGLSPLEALLISMTNVTSAGQFAGAAADSRTGIVPRSCADAADYQPPLCADEPVHLPEDGFGYEHTAPPVLLFHEYGRDICRRIQSAGEGQSLVFVWVDDRAVPRLVGRYDSGRGRGHAAAGFPPQCARYRDFRHVPRHHPAARAQGEAVRIVVLMAIAMSLCFRYVPMLSQVSSGFVIIICAIAASALGAWLFPVQEEETKAGDAQ